MLRFVPTYEYLTVKKKKNLVTYLSNNLKNPPKPKSEGRMSDPKLKNDKKNRVRKSEQNA